MPDGRTPLSDRFTWPPRDGRAPTTAGAIVIPREVARPGFERWLRPGPSWWAEFERAFLAPTHEPIARRAIEAGWRPDAADRYCPRCGASVGPHEVRPILGPGSAPGCNACRDERLRWARAFRLGPYEGVLRDWIHELKFERFRPAGRALGRLLGERLKVELEAAGIDRARAMLAPIPMSRRRRWSRGIDHTLELARGIREVTGLRIVRLLARRHGPGQLEVSPSRRKANASRSLRARAGPAARLRGGGRLVILVDDVRTTGSTLTAAARVIRRAAERGAEGAGRARETGGEALQVWVATAGVTPRRGEGASGAGVEATGDGGLDA